MTDRLDAMADDLDVVLQMSLQHSSTSLRHGTLTPFAVQMDLAREVATIEPEAAEENDADALLPVLRTHLRETEDLLAVAIVSPAQHEGRDAVRIELEHRDGLAVVTHHLWRKGMLGRVVFLDEEIMAASTPTIFVAS